MQALQASEAEFRAIFELSPVGMVQTSVYGGKYVRATAKLYEWMGYSAHELAAHTHADITHEGDRILDNEGRQRCGRT